MDSEIVRLLEKTAEKMNELILLVNIIGKLESASSPHRETNREIMDKLIELKKLIDEYTEYTI